MRIRRGESGPDCRGVARPGMSMGERVLEKLVRETTVEIKNAEGLHMRPAMQFVDTANRFH